MTPYGPVDLRPAWPALIVAITGVVVLLVQALTPRGRRAPFAALSLVGLAAALLAVALIAMGRGRGVVMGGAVAADDFSLFFHALLLGITAGAVLLSPSYLRATGIERGEYYALVLFSLVGMLGLVSCRELVSLFVALEIMSVALYALAGLHRDRPASQESAMSGWSSSRAQGASPRSGPQVKTRPAFLHRRTVEDTVEAWPLSRPSLHEDMHPRACHRLAGGITIQTQKAEERRRPRITDGS